MYSVLQTAFLLQIGFTTVLFRATVTPRVCNSPYSNLEPASSSYYFIHKNFYNYLSKKEKTIIIFYLFKFFFFSKTHYKFRNFKTLFHARQYLNSGALPTTAQEPGRITYHSRARMPLRVRVAHMGLSHPQRQILKEAALLCRKESTSPKSIRLPTLPLKMSLLNKVIPARYRNRKIVSPILLHVSRGLNCFVLSLLIFLLPSF